MILGMVNALHSSKSSQWFTIPRLLSLVRDFIGGPIDLDPASCALANQLVMANRFFDGDAADGMVDSWECESLFCNPPYSRHDGGPVGRWVARALEQRRLIRRAGAMLVNATPGAPWFTSLWTDCDVCFFDDRVPFWEPTHQALTRFVGEHRRDLLERLPELLSRYEAIALLREVKDDHALLEVAPGLVEGPSPTHYSAMVRLAGSQVDFIRVFGRHGVVIPAGSAVYA